MGVISGFHYVIPSWMHVSVRRASFVQDEFSAHSCMGGRGERQISG